MSWHLLLSSFEQNIILMSDHSLFFPRNNGHLNTHLVKGFESVGILTHFRLKALMRLSPHYIWEELNFNFRYVRPCDLGIPREKMAKLFANSGDPDQMLHSDLGLHCLPVIILGSPG